MMSTFPNNYRARRCAGQPAAFRDDGDEVAIQGRKTINEEFAKRSGLSRLDKLRTRARAAGAETHGAHRGEGEAQLLDALNEGHHFESPPTLIEKSSP